MDLLLFTLTQVSNWLQIISPTYTLVYTGLPGISLESTSSNVPHQSSRILRYSLGNFPRSYSLYRHHLRGAFIPRERPELPPSAADACSDRSITFWRNKIWPTITDYCWLWLTIADYFSPQLRNWPISLGHTTFVCVCSTIRRAPRPWDCSPGDVFTLRRCFLVVAVVVFVAVLLYSFPFSFYCCCCCSCSCSCHRRCVSEVLIVKKLLIRGASCMLSRTPTLA